MLPKIFKLLVVMWFWSYLIFIQKRKITVTEQSRVIIQELLHIKITNKFIKVKNVRSYLIHQGIDHSGSIKISRVVRNCWCNQNIIKNARYINLLNSFIVKRNFEKIFSGHFFLSRAGGLSILESWMSNAIKCHWVYRKLLTSLRLSSRRIALCCKCLFFMDERCILEKLGDKRWNLKLKLKINVKFTQKCIWRKRNVQCVDVTSRNCSRFSR